MRGFVCATWAVLAATRCAAQGDCGAGGIAGITARLQAVETACCEGQKCSAARNGGMPADCTLTCASEFTPFYTDCRTMLSGLGDSFTDFADQCASVVQTQSHGCGLSEFMDASMACADLMNGNANIPSDFCQSQCYSNVAPFLDACQNSLDPAVDGMLNSGQL